MDLTDIWAVMLNRRAKKNSQKVLENLDIKPGDSVADIGSGGGYFTLELANRTGKSGIVFAVDTNKALLDRMDKMVQKSQLRNIETVTGREDGCSLPKESCDFIFMRNVFHHIQSPVSYFQNLGKGLKPGGRIAVIDYTQNTKRRHIFSKGHFTPEEKIRTTMLQAGYEHLKSFGFLEGQSFNIFQKVQ